MERYEVVVVGGGFAGVAGASAAARQGAKVLLIEKGGSLGGAATNALVNPFMLNATKIDGKTTELSQGIFREICLNLLKKDAVVFSESGFTRFSEETLKFVLDDMTTEAGVDVLFHSYLCGVKKNGDTVKAVEVATKRGIYSVAADYFIDATGDAQLSFLAGCPFELGRKKDGLCQPMTLCFRLGNVDTERFFQSRAHLNEEYKKALEAGKLINPRENVLVFRTTQAGVLHLNTTRIIKLDPTSPVDLSKAEKLARKQVLEIYEFMKEHADGLENSFLMMTAPEIGVRESRKIVGDYVLTERDCRAFTKFPDAVAACQYDIDIHSPDGTGTSHYYFPEGEYYTVPYRSLIPKGVENMLVAGRCISSDQGAQASFRIMPTVCTLGEAAGIAAALAVKGKCSVRQIDVSSLQEILKENGAFIGI